MIYKEVQADLFSYHDKGYYLVHCISADFALGAGIAKEFDRRYDIRKLLLFYIGCDWYKQYGKQNIDYCIIVGGKTKVINLITKQRYFQKPTIESLRRALLDLKRNCERYNIKKLAMPRIGCGLDKLNWVDVFAEIRNVFQDTDLEIIICYL